MDAFDSIRAEEEKVLEHTHTPRAPRFAFLIRHKPVWPVLPVMNEPAAVAVLLAMNAQVKLGMGPFVSVLCDLEIPDTAGERLVEAHDFAFFVLCDARFHKFDRSPGNDAVLCPILVTLTLFMFFPVFGFSMVAAHTGPGRPLLVK